MPLESNADDSIYVEHDHVVVAQWQLLQALRLYEQDEDYYSVITLAGAAEEIFGRVSRKMGLGSALDTLKTSLPTLTERFLRQEMTTGEVISSVNQAKNWLKHGTDTLIFDARFEAEDMLDRAIRNCWPVVTTGRTKGPKELTSRLLDAISRYDDPDR